MTHMPSNAAAGAAKSFISGTMSPAEALLLHLEVGKRMRTKYDDGDGSYFHIASNASWTGGLTETLAGLLFAEAESPSWKPTHMDYHRAVMNKTAARGGAELKKASAWRDRPSQNKRGHGRISDVDLFVPRSGLLIGYWRQFAPSVPPSFSHLLETEHEAFGCQVKMRLDWLDVADDGHDALHWSYFVEPDTFELDDFLDKPRWLPQPVDLFLVVKFSVQNGKLTARARLFDRVSIQEQILESVRNRFEAGRRELSFKHQRFSVGDCMTMPSHVGADVSVPFTKLIQLPMLGPWTP